MQSIATLFQVNPPEEKMPASERAYIVSLFVDEINNEREKNGWRYKVGDKWKKLKPLTGRAAAIRLSTLKTKHDLREFLSICKDYQNRHGSFAKRFFTKSEFK